MLANEIRNMSVDELLTQEKELKQELYNRYAEDFAEINKNILLATEVRENFKGIERNFLPNDLQFILLK